MDLPSGDVEHLAEESMRLVIEQLKRITAVLEAGPLVRSIEMRAAMNDLGIVSDMARHLFPALPSAYRNRAPKE
jgi:hypothetical protein